MEVETVRSGTLPVVAAVKLMTAPLAVEEDHPASDPVKTPVAPELL